MPAPKKSDTKSNNGKKPLFDNPDEEWIETYDNPRFLVSTHGRVFDSKMCKITPGRIKNGKMMVVYGGRDHELASVVLKSFTKRSRGAQPRKKNFKDGDALNCQLDNLEWMTETTVYID